MLRSVSLGYVRGCFNWFGLVWELAFVCVGYLFVSVGVSFGSFRDCFGLALVGAGVRVGVVVYCLLVLVRLGAGRCYIWLVLIGVC